MKWLVVVSKLWHLGSWISGLFSPESWLAHTLCPVWNRKAERSRFSLWPVYLQNKDKWFI